MDESKEREHNAGAAPEAERRGHGFLAGVLVGGLVGVLIAGAAMFATSPIKAAARWPMSMSRGPRGMCSHEAARARFEMATDFLLWKVDATNDQCEKVKAVTKDAMDDLTGLAKRHHDDRETLLNELAKPSVNRAALEGLRKTEMGLADEASQRLLTAIADVADVLTPDQRAQLVELAHEFHR